MPKRWKLFVITGDTVKMNTIKTYSELKKIPTFEKRFEYLKLEGIVGVETFGYERYLNQSFYRSREWKKIRDEVILRDNGCDLGIEGYDIFKRVIIHHMNPISRTDIVDHTDMLLNPEYLICVSKRTHDAIHYGDSDLLPKLPIERSKNDMCPWKR